MAKRSKFFCIAVEGATCDGRALDANSLQEMADTYAPATYAARVNMEHIRGFSAEPPFNAYGDVVALETRQVDIELGGKTVKKLGLFAQVDALDNLLAIQTKGQKLFSSVEINYNFAETGKAYLQGMAVTDSPASLGTEIMTFAAGQVAAGKVSPFADRKIEKDNVFTAAREIEGFEFEEGTAPQESGAAAMFAAATDFFKGFGKQEGPASPPATPETPPANSSSNDGVTALASQLGVGLGKLTDAVTAAQTENAARFTKIETNATALAASIENTPKGGGNRPPATGGDSTNYTNTDC